MPRHAHRRTYAIDKVCLRSPEGGYCQEQTGQDTHATSTFEIHPQFTALLWVLEYTRPTSPIFIALCEQQEHWLTKRLNGVETDGLHIPTPHGVAD